jgi:hypothetical protein
MTFPPPDELHRRAVALGLVPTSLASCDLQVRRLKGGLEATSVRHVTTRSGGRNRTGDIYRFVVKELGGWAVREAEIYRQHSARGTGAIAPQFLAAEAHHPERLLLYMEAIEAVEPWPWRNLSASIRVTETLAALHSVPGAPAESVPMWDYESHLQHVANATLEQLQSCTRTSGCALFSAALPELRRVVLALPEMREWLFSLSEFGSPLIHGDVHPGNVRLRRRFGRVDVILIDWARARIGSPMEDVSSWLQSLAYWEPEARRKHDSLLKAYLHARGHGSDITNRVRAAYWIAAGSNALGGALLYHLGRVRENRGKGIKAVLDWIRIIRRADEHWAAINRRRTIPLKNRVQGISGADGTARRKSSSFVGNVMPLPATQNGVN